MRGAIPPLPNVPPWHVAGQLYFLFFFYFYRVHWQYFVMPKIILVLFIGEYETLSTLDFK
jgi:hypothetical protein